MEVAVGKGVSRVRYFLERRDRLLDGPLPNLRYTCRVDWSLCGAVDRSPGKLGGTRCFRGTRAPVISLVDHLDQGSTIEEFLEWFPSVGLEQLHYLLGFAKSSLEQPTAVS